METLACGIGAVLALLLADLGVQTVLRRRPPDGPGRRLLLAARLFGLFLLAGAVAGGCRTGADLATDLQWMAVFGLCGLVAFEATIALGERLLADFAAAARSDGLAAATALACHHAATGILLANVCAGHSVGDLAVAGGAFVVGQATLLVLVWLFRRLTSYDDRVAICGGNVAAALAHGGLQLAMALLVAHASDGEFQGLWPALRGYAVALGEGLLVYPVRQFVVQCLILRSRPTLLGGALDQAIGERRDVGAGALEAATYLAAALLVRSLG